MGRKIRREKMKTILNLIALISFINFIPFCVSLYQASSEKNNLENEISKYEQCQELRALTQEGEQISQELKQTEQKIKQILISIVLIIVSAIIVFGMFSWCDSWFDPLE